MSLLSTSLRISRLLRVVRTSYAYAEPPVSPRIESNFTPLTCANSMWYNTRQLFAGDFFSVRTFMARRTESPGKWSQRAEVLRACLSVPGRNFYRHKEVYIARLEQPFCVFKTPLFLSREWTQNPCRSFLFRASLSQCGQAAEH